MVSYIEPLKTGRQEKGQFFCRKSKCTEYTPLQRWEILIQLRHSIKRKWSKYTKQETETVRVDKKTQDPSMRCRQETHCKYKQMGDLAEVREGQLWSQPAYD